MDATEQGEDGFLRRSKERHDNPFPRGSEDHRQWDAGWSKGHKYHYGRPAGDYDGWWHAWDRANAKPLDFSDFVGPKLNEGWKPDPQELVYAAITHLQGDGGDADQDCAEQIIERLLDLIRCQLPKAI